MTACLTMFLKNNMSGKNICSEILIATLFIRAKLGNNLNIRNRKNSEIMTHVYYSFI